MLTISRTRVQSRSFEPLVNQTWPCHSSAHAPSLRVFTRPAKSATWPGQPLPRVNHMLQIWHVQWPLLRLQRGHTHWNLPVDCTAYSFAPTLCSFPLFSLLFSVPRKSWNAVWFLRKSVKFCYLVRARKGVDGKRN